jgi:hypothetical protein
MAGLEKEIKKVAKGSSGKRAKKSGGTKKSGSGVEKFTQVPSRSELSELRIPNPVWDLLLTPLRLLVQKGDWQEVRYNVLWR